MRYSASWKKASSSSATSDTLMTTTRTARLRAHVHRKGHRCRPASQSARASIEVRIDGTYAGKISLWASSFKARQTVFSRAWLTTATRTIELRTVTGSSRKVVSLDAFVVTR